ncbi:hypothetical protein ACHAXS_002352 [Conticribra weissflogii]
MDNDNLLNESLLPRDILLNSILPHLDLQALVNLSSASKLCHRLVFLETPPTRWSKIRFLRDRTPSDGTHGSTKRSDGARRTHTCKITDEQLKAFLTRVNARENTREISLWGCDTIRGGGLTPLSGSRVLETIDLRVTGAKNEANIDYSAVVALLGTMLPLLPAKETEAVLPSNHPSSWERNNISVETMERMKMYYRPFTLQRVVFPPGHEKRGIVTYFHQCHRFWKRFKDCWNADGKYCSTCNTLFGKETSAPAWKCRACGEYSCRTSNDPENGPIREEQVETDDDDDDGPMRRCQSVCVRCAMCHDEFCSKYASCQNCISCPVCEKWFCEPCAMPRGCSVCHVRKCIWCSNIVECAACRKECCANHGFEGCGCCDRVFCEDCQQKELGFCVVCNKCYCSISCHDSAH